MSSYRLPDLTPGSMTAEQQQAYDAIKASPRGVVQGPLLAWLQSPALADRAQALGAFCRYHTSLPPRLSELAIITTGAFWKAGFEWHVHAPIAIAAGLDPAPVEALRLGQTPNFDKPDEHAVWQFAHHLLHDHAVPDTVYRTVESLLGATATVDLVGVLGYYGLISMTIKAFNVPVPEGAAEPF
jgi:4-carboxymuconolactone decarboxylase